MSSNKTQHTSSNISQHPMSEFLLSRNCSQTNEMGVQTEDMPLGEKCAWCKRLTKNNKSLCDSCRYKRKSKNIAKRVKQDESYIQVEQETKSISLQKLVPFGQSFIYEMPLLIPSSVGRLFTIHLYFNDKLWGNNLYLKAHNTEIHPQFKETGKLHFIMDYKSNQECSSGFLIMLVANYVNNPTTLHTYGLNTRRFDNIKLCSKEPFPVDQECKFEYFSCSNSYPFGGTNNIKDEVWDYQNYLQHYVERSIFTAQNQQSEPISIIVERHVEHLPPLKNIFTFDCGNVLLHALDFQQSWFKSDLPFNRENLPTLHLKHFNWKWSSNKKLPWHLFMGYELQHLNTPQAYALQFLQPWQRHDCLDLITNGKSQFYLWTSEEHQSFMETFLKKVNMTFFHVYNVCGRQKTSVFPLDIDIDPNTL